MALPPDFQFSQGSLQDYVDCPRRFELTYVRRLRWPAPEAEPAMENEQFLRRGAAFHRLVHQHLTGVPVERLSGTVTGPDLRRWWRNYLESGPADLPRTRYPEVVLSAPLAGSRLVAKYDLVAVAAGERAAESSAAIVDWKTNRKRPRREWLAQRLQTRVYPYLLARAGAQLNGGVLIRPEQVTMVYWFANFPATPERFAYDAARYEADEVRLIDLIEEIVGQGDDAPYPRTDDERRCRYCRYRSLCQRGVEAGPLSGVEEEPASDEDFEFEIDFEQIAEIAY